MTSRVERLAAAVVDGESVDWDSARASLASEEERAIAAQLEHLSAISLGGDQARPSAWVRLPWLLRMARLVAAVTSAVAIASWLLLLFADAGRPLVFLVSIGFFLGAALWLDFMGRTDRRAQALAGVYWTSAASFGHDLILGMSRLPFWSVDLSILQGVRPEAFFPLFLWQFAREFPRVTRFSAIDRIATAGLVVAGVASVVLFVSNLAARLPIGQAASTFALLDRTHDHGRLFWLVLLSLALAALVCIVLRGELAERPERTRVRLFLWTIASAVIPMAAVVMAESASPAVDAFMRTDSGRILGAVVVYPPMFAFPVLTAYVVLASEVLDVQVTALRVLHYLLARWLLAWGTVVPAAILATLIYVDRDEPVSVTLAASHARVLLWMAAAGAVAFVFRERVLRQLDRWMLSGIANPSETLADLGAELRMARTALELSSGVARAVKQALHAEVDVYVVEGRDTLMPTASPDGGSVRRDSLVPVLLQGAAGPCVVAPRGRESYFDLLSPTDREWIQRDSIVALGPILSSVAGRVRLVIAVRARRNGLGVSRADLQFLSAACAAAALAAASMEQSIAAPADEELALQCVTCARVVAWSSNPPACGCGGSWEQAALPETVSGRFRLESLLGAGGMGIVYRAVDIGLGRKVAIKTVPRLSPEAGQRLVEEARAMAALQHPHVAILYGAEEWRGTPVLIVEHLEGKTLAQRLRGGRVPVDAALSFGIALADALDYMHNEGRLHGDVKPSNIAFTASGVAKFLDFGLSRVVAGELHDDRQFGGTVAYLSPELLDGAMPSPAADVWALSVVMFEALAGYHPFQKGPQTVRSIRAGLDAGASLSGLLPQPAVDFLAGLLAPDPSARPSTAAALRARLEDVRFGHDARSGV